MFKSYIGMGDSIDDLVHVEGLGHLVVEVNVLILVQQGLLLGTL